MFRTDLQTVLEHENHPTLFKSSQRFVVTVPPKSQTLAENTKCQKLLHQNAKKKKSKILFMLTTFLLHNHDCVPVCKKK